MDISQNSISNEALWIFYDRLLQQARQLERTLATSSDRVNSATPSDAPQTNDPITPIRQINGHDSGDPEDEGRRGNDQPSPSLDPDQREVSIVLSSSPDRPETPSVGRGQSPEVIVVSSGSSSVRTQTPPERRVPLQRRQQFPLNLRDVPEIQTIRAEVLETHESRQLRRRIIIKREKVDEYRGLVDKYMGVRYNIYTDSPDELDISESSIEEPQPLNAQVLSLVTANAYVEVAIIEDTAYDISGLGLAREGNYYIGRFDFEGAAQRIRPMFRERTWANLVSEVGALGEDFDTAYPKICNFLRSRQKLVTFASIGPHATVLTLVRGSKTATFFDTYPSRNNQSRARVLCSVVIRSVFNETTEGWTLQFAQVGRQNPRANNCCLHSLLRIRDELEDNNEYDTNETSANTLRLYLALRGAYGEARYPLTDIIN